MSRLLSLITLYDSILIASRLFWFNNAKAHLQLLHVQRTALVLSYLVVLCGAVTGLSIFYKNILRTSAVTDLSILSGFSKEVPTTGHFSSFTTLPVYVHDSSLLPDMYNTS